MKANEIRELYDKKHNTTECRRMAQRYLKEGLISQTQFQWLAGLGCLGTKLKWQIDEYNKLMAKQNEEMYSSDRILR